MQRLALARFDALYLCLPLCVGFLLRWLQRLSLPSAPALRGWAAAVYVLHPWCIVLIRGGAGVVGLTGLLVDNCLVHYLAVVLLSALLALPFARIRPAPSPEPGLDRAGCRRPAAQSGRPGLPSAGGGQPYAGNQGQRLRARGLGDRPAVRRGGRGRLCRGHRRRGRPPAAGRRPGTILVLGYSGPELAPCWPGTA